MSGHFLYWSVACLLVLNLTGGEAQAEESQQAAPAASERAPKAESERIICKTLPTTGSRLAKQKICGTARELADLRQQQREMIERGQLEQGGSRCPPMSKLC